MSSPITDAELAALADDFIDAVNRSGDWRWEVRRNDLDLGAQGLSYLEEVVSWEMQPGAGETLATILNDAGKWLPALLARLDAETARRESAEKALRPFAALDPGTPRFRTGNTGIYGVMYDYIEAARAHFTALTPTPPETKE